MHYDYNVGVHSSSMFLRKRNLLIAQLSNQEKVGPVSITVFLPVYMMEFNIMIDLRKQKNWYSCRIINSFN